ncbi:MAG TPA: hypothetical protein VGN52_11340 [Burkholderiales bacterium]|jgi:hypothetical protein
MIDEDEEDRLGSRWPMNGDRLFVEGTFGFGSPLTDDIGERLYRMPKAYKRAGDLLISQGLADCADRANVIYPALYCYRQAIELYLKVLINAYGSEEVKDRKYGHNFELLWQGFVDICAAQGDGGAEDLGIVANLVMEFHKADRLSDGFRYPTDKHGKPFSMSADYLDVDNLRDTVSGLENFFQCVDLEWSSRIHDAT